MRKSVISILMIVSLMIPFTYANGGELLTKYDKWLAAYDFDAIIEDLESGKSGIVGTAMFKIKDMAKSCRDFMQNFNIEVDKFTGEKRVTHKDLISFGDGCQVYPFIDEYGLNMFVGFPYQSSMHYDKIYLNLGSDGILEFDRYDKDHGFDIQFEKLNGTRWEYSLLSGLDIPLSNILSVSFREKGSVSKVDYILTNTEMYSVNALNAIYHTMKNLRFQVEIIDKQRK